MPSDMKVLAEDHFDPLLWINNKLGFGIKPGDTIEIIKKTTLYRQGGKTESLPLHSHFIVLSSDDKFVVVASKLMAAKSGKYTEDKSYKGSFIDNDPQNYIVVPALMKSTVQSVQQGETAVKEAAASAMDFLGDLKSYLKWGLIGLAILLVILLILKFK